LVSCSGYVQKQDQKGVISSDLLVGIYKPDLVYEGHTLVLDSADPKKPIIVEIDMKGKIVWYYVIPKPLLVGCDISKGPDIEWIPDSNNILFILPQKGIYEINRQKQIVWCYENKKASHDADRLPNGNTLFTCGWDKRSDAQVIEIDMKGKTVWKWFAVNCLENEVRPRRYNMERGGFFHANSAMRLKNGNTLISLKGYDMVLEVNPNGEAVWIKRGVIRVHDPSILENGNILLATNKPYGLYELSREGLVTWSYFKSDVQTITCCNRLPNGNTLVAARNNILELSAHGKVVWKLTNRKVSWEIDPVTPKKKRKQEWVKLRHQWFYKAERISARYNH
jgi:hypothetical protein